MKDLLQSNQEYRKKPPTTIGKRHITYFALSLIILFVVAFGCLTVRVQYERKKQEVGLLMRQKRKLETKILPLLLEKRSLTQYSVISKLANGTFGLKESDLHGKITITVIPEHEKRNNKMLRNNKP